MRAAIAIVALLLCGCDDFHTQSTSTGLKYGLVVIDGCQYLQVPGACGYGSITHKGDCTNSIHKQVSVTYVPAFSNSYITNVYDVQGGLR